MPQLREQPGYIFLRSRVDTLWENPPETFHALQNKVASFEFEMTKALPESRWSASVRWDTGADAAVTLRLSTHHFADYIPCPRLVAPTHPLQQAATRLGQLLWENALPSEKVEEIRQGELRNLKEVHELSGVGLNVRGAEVYGICEDVCSPYRYLRAAWRPTDRPFFESLEVPVQETRAAPSTTLQRKKIEEAAFLVELLRREGLSNEGTRLAVETLNHLLGGGEEGLAYEEVAPGLVGHVFPVFFVKGEPYPLAHLPGPEPSEEGISPPASSEEEIVPEDLGEMFAHLRENKD